MKEAIKELGNDFIQTHVIGVRAKKKKKKAEAKAIKSLEKNKKISGGLIKSAVHILWSTIKFCAATVIPIIVIASAFSGLAFSFSIGGVIATGLVTAVSLFAEYKFVEGYGRNLNRLFKNTPEEFSLKETIISVAGMGKEKRAEKRKFREMKKEQRLRLKEIKSRESNIVDENIVREESKVDSEDIDDNIRINLRRLSGKSESSEKVDNPFAGFTLSDFRNSAESISSGKLVKSNPFADLTLSDFRMDKKAEESNQFSGLSFSDFRIGKSEEVSSEPIDKVGQPVAVDEPKKISKLYVNTELLKSIQQNKSSFRVLYEAPRLLENTNEENTSKKR